MKKRIWKDILKKALTTVAICTMVISAVPIVSQGAVVTKGSYDFSGMVVRRVWFNTNDPVFLIDNYQRVWLDKNSNVIATGNYKTTDSKGDLMAPMKEMFAQLGVDYNENGNEVTIVLNSDTLKLTTGSKDVVYNGTKLADELTDPQIPQKVNVKEKFAEYNTFLTGDYEVTYLPVAYILNKLGADIYVDGNVQSFYAAVPVMKTAQMPSYTTVAEGYGSRYDDLIKGNLKAETAVADNIVELQNTDGGFQSLPANADLKQTNLSNKLGTLKSNSTLLDGATIAELKYLADYITEFNPTDTKYQQAFQKGIDYLIKNQSSQGGWQISPTNPEGFNANIEVGNNVTVSILSLLNEVAVLNNPNYIFARRSLDIQPLKEAINKGNEFLLNSQISYDGVKSGWASQYKADGTVTMGRTYERESVSTFTTKAVTEYMMSIHNPSQAIIKAVEDAVSWLQKVKIDGKEQKSIEDNSMNNGFDVYLVDGNGTWASNYVYDAAQKSYRPLYSDVDPTRPDQKYVNTYDLANVDRSGTNVTSKDLILYATRTTIPYYDNTLANKLMGEDYAVWTGYLTNGFPAIPTDPVQPDGNQGEGNNKPDVNGGEGNQNADDVSSDAVSDSQEQSKTNSKTGDSRNIWIYIIPAAAAICIIGGFGVYELMKRKKNQK